MTISVPAVPAPTLNDAAKSATRALIPWVVAQLVWLIQTVGFHVSAGPKGQLFILVGFGLTAGLRALEVRWPWFGRLLGFPLAVQPPSKKTLVADAAAVQAALIVQLQAQVAALRATPPQAPPAGAVPVAPLG